MTPTTVVLTSLSECVCVRASLLGLLTVLFLVSKHSTDHGKTHMYARENCIIIQNHKNDYPNRGSDQLIGVQQEFTTTTYVDATTFCIYRVRKLQRKKKRKMHKGKGW